jgi:hypothetical protein
MRVKKIAIKNFRLLEDVELSLEEITTVIVGRNNSGKTSLTELFRRILSGNEPEFALQDFSLGAHEQFWEAFVLKSTLVEENKIREALPAIEARLTLSYATSAPSLGPLSDFIVDLNPDCSDALIVIRYELRDGRIDALFEGLPVDQSPEGRASKADVFRAIKERVSKLYGATLKAVDPGDPTNERSQEWPKIKALLQTGFINAQRGLDDETRRTSEVLSGILQNLFNNARLESANQEDRDIAIGLENAVQGIQAEIDGDFQKKLSSLLPAFGLFGYPGLPDPQLCTETILDVDRLLTNHTRVRYVGVNGVTLPESYNGLGVRNLIYILLRLLQFFKDFKAKPASPGVHLVFIEEPEVHLHPQMQEVFIRQLEKVVDTFNKQHNDGSHWPVQFVVTTHSSHIANEAPFVAMRYFLSKRRGAADGYRQTHIKDLRKGILDEPDENQRFLHQYMTLTRCDLLFADKAVLIEGTAERLLLPRMIEKVETTKDVSLRNKYISTVEVGGAYAHRFFKLLEFLELRTLIVTDLDSGRKNKKERIAASKVSEGTHTTNACLTTWFGDAQISPSQLIKKTPSEKTVGFVHIEYQVPEGEGLPCGRTFEDAFMLANPKLFGLTGKDSKDQEEEVWKRMEDGIDKVGFALDHAINTIDWIVPRYIQDGLCWLGEVPGQSGAFLAQAAKANVDRRGKAAGDA